MKTILSDSHPTRLLFFLILRLFQSSFVLFLFCTFLEDIFCELDACFCMSSNNVDRHCQIRIPSFRLKNVLLRNFRIPPGNVLEIFKIMNYFFNRIQIKIVHVSEIDSLLGNQGLDFLFVR